MPKLRDKTAQELVNARTIDGAPIPDRDWYQERYRQDSAQLAELLRLDAPRAAACDAKDRAERQARDAELERRRIEKQTKEDAARVAEQEKAAQERQRAKEISA